MFLNIAKNGCGLVIPGIAPIRNMLGGKWLHKVNKAYKDLAVWMEEFHKTGATLFVQITTGFGRSFSIPNGLKGIVPKRNYIIRPLINVNREDVENFCTKNSISYVNDSTNFLDDYTRNKIRHNVIPVLKNINSNAETSATYLSEDAFEVTELLENMASEALENSKKENKD